MRYNHQSIKNLPWFTSYLPGALVIRLHSMPACRACGSNTLFFCEREHSMRISAGRLNFVRVQLDLLCEGCFDLVGSLPLGFANVAEWNGHLLAHINRDDHRPAAEILSVNLVDVGPNIVRCGVAWATGCSCGACLGGGELSTRIDIREVVQP